MWRLPHLKELRLTYVILFYKEDACYDLKNKILILNWGRVNPVFYLSAIVPVNASSTALITWE